MSLHSLKQEYLVPLHTLQQLVEEQFLPENCHELIQTLIDEMAAYRFTLSLAGKFSAGKSTLLNTWLGQDIQPVDLIACTTLATEFHYVPKKELEQCVFYPKPTLEQDNPTPQTLSLAAYQEHAKTGQLDFNTLARIEIHLYVPALARYPDIILVDTPGLGSAKGLHDAALQHYCGITTAFILCVTRQSLIGQEERNFILRQRQLGQEVILLVCQEDLTLPQERQAIRQTILTQSGLSPTTPIYGCSAFDTSIGLHEFETILKNCTEKKEHFFHSHFQFKLQALLQHISALLKIGLTHPATISTLKAEQKTIQNGITSLFRDLEKEEAKIRREANGYLKEKVLSMIEQYLRTRHHTYVERILNKQDIETLLKTDVQQATILSFEQILPEAFASIQITLNQHIQKINTSVNTDALHLSSESGLMEGATQHLTQKGIGMILKKIPVNLFIPPNLLLAIGTLIAQWLIGIFRTRKQRKEAETLIQQTIEQIIQTLSHQIPLILQENINIFVTQLKADISKQITLQEEMLQKVTIQIQENEQLIQQRQQKTEQALTQLQFFMQTHFIAD